jgi:predicted nucleotidyltransferase
MAFDAYVARHAERRAQAGRDLAVHAAAAFVRAREIARVLVQTFGVRRVILFGSLARGAFGPRSDVDLAVEGLPPGALLEAHVVAAAVAKELDVSVVPVERADVFARAAIRGDGVVLWPEA